MTAKKKSTQAGPPTETLDTGQSAAEPDEHVRARAVVAAKKRADALKSAEPPKEE
jgi:hypothetical protein